MQQRESDRHGQRNPVAWIHGIANRPVTLPDVTYTLRAECSSPQDAALASQILQSSAVATTVVDCRLRVVFVLNRRGAPTLKNFSRQVHQRVADAGIVVVSAQLSPSAPPSRDRTWHLPALRKGRWFPTAEEAKTMRSGSAELLPANHDFPVLRHDDLRRTDRPQILDIPMAWWTLMSSSLFVILAAVVGLSGTDRWWTPPIAIGLLIALISAALVAWTSHGHYRWTPIAIPLAAYGLGFIQAESAPGRIQWLQAIAVIIATLTYFGGLWLTIRYLRGLNVKGATLLSVAAGIGGALVGSRIFVDSIAYSFATGFGLTYLPPDLSGFEVLRILGIGSISDVAVRVMLLSLLIVLDQIFDLGDAVRLLGISLGTLFVTLLMLQLWLSAIASGEATRSGYVDKSGGRATCVEILSGPDGIPGVGSRKSWVLIGPVRGPALIADPLHAKGDLVLTGGGLNVRTVGLTDGRCQ